jgi:hypothetical protein
VVVLGFAKLTVLESDATAGSNVCIRHGEAAVDFFLPLDDDDLRDEDDDRLDPREEERLFVFFLRRSFFEGERPRSFRRFAGAAGLPCKNWQLLPCMQLPLAKYLQGIAERHCPLPGDLDLILPLLFPLGDLLRPGLELRGLLGDWERVGWE